MYFYSFCLTMSLWKISEAIFTFQCPVQSHWKHRAEAICGPVDSYFCLFDRYRNGQNYTEFCRENSDFEAPGQKLIVAGSLNGTLQGAPCRNYFYQPFKFLSSGNSRCVYKKSYCSEEGQVKYGNGTQKTDGLCRCDYRRGYNFITRPKHGCYCEPTTEDCSCYSKMCPSNYALSPDYECLNENEWKTSFGCKPIEAVGLPGSSQIPSSVIPFFGHYTTVNFEIEKYRKTAFVAVLVMTLFIIILIICIFIPTSKFLTLGLIPCFTDTNMDNGKSDTEGNTDADKQELKDNFNDLDFVKIPPHLKDFQIETLHDWENKLKKFVKTRASDFIYQKVLKRNIIVISGPSGCGKSTIAYYTAFKLKENYGFTIFPARQSEDITNYHVPGTKQIFIIDDFIGKYIINEADVYLWEKHWSLLKNIFENNDEKKLFLTSRSYVWQPERYNCLSLDPYTCELSSDLIKLSLTERWDIFYSYFQPDELKALNDETIEMYSFFPYLCSSYKSSENIKVFFTAPREIIEDEINNFKITSPASFIALAIIAIEQTVSKSSLSIDQHAYDDLIQDVFHESAFLQYPSKSLLLSSLVALTGTYLNHVVKNNTEYFIFIHETLQKVVLRCIARTLIKSVIKYCKIEVILNQLRFDYFYEELDIFTIDVTAENEDTYFRRLVYELDKGWNDAIFKNEQNKFRDFRVRFLSYMKKYFLRDNRTKTQDGIPILHVVSSLGYKDYTSFFSQDNTMVNLTDSSGNIPLHLACMGGHKEVVLNLVEKKSKIDVANNEGFTPLVYACENNATAVANVLLQQCAKLINVNAKYQKKNNESVLHIVSAKGFVNLVLILLENNADVNIQDKNGFTPLHVANDRAVVKALLAFKANINLVDAFGRSPLYLACSSKKEKVLELLIENNADINQKTKTGLRPLHAACHSESIGIVKMLIEKGAKITSSRPGIMPLHEACKVGNESIINTLIAANVSVNHKTKDGFTPLHEACKKEHFNVVKILLDNKANVNEASKYGWTALFFSCSNGCSTIVDLLLQHGANLNIYDEDKCSPLMLACKEEYTDVVNSLLSSKADINICDSDNCSSLLIACKTGNVDVVSVLLKYAADINLADKDMITPLHAACMNNNNTMLVLKLLENNANVNITDKTGQTPLFKSIVNGYTDIIDILLRHGASVDIRDKTGNSPLAIAEIKGHTTIVHILKQHKPNNQIT